MSGLAFRFGQLTQPVVRYTKTKVEVLFSRKYLLFTNTGITLTLGCTGDIIQQRYEILCKRQSHWDPQRTKRISVTNLFIGPTCHFWYLILDALFPGRKVGMILKKILLDQIIFSPVNISMFLVIMGLQEEMTGKEIIKDLKEKGKDLLVAEWIVWPPAQLINFFFLPTKYRVLYDNAVSLGFDYYYSYVKFRKGKEDTAEDSKRSESKDNCEEKEDDNDN